MVATLKDVARRANVSISTASLVVNNRKGVTDRTRQKILRAMKELDYRPNLIARGLAKKKTNNINVIISGPRYAHVSSPILFEVIEGIAEKIADSEHQLVLNLTTQEREVQFIEDAIAGRVCDAIILWGCRMSDRDLVRLCSSDIPVVVLGRYVRHEQLHSVTVDDFGGAYAAAEYLIACGHRRIGYIGLLQEISSAKDRFDGYVKALTDHGIEAEHELLAEGDFYQQSGFAAMERLLPYCNQGMTAVLAGSDLMALGAMEAAKARGLQIPGQISVVGFDNIPNAGFFLVPLTTVAMPFRSMGGAAGETALALLRKEDPVPAQVLDVKLVKRESVRCITDQGCPPLR